MVPDGPPFTALLTLLPELLVIGAGCAALLLGQGRRGATVAPLVTLLALIAGLLLVRMPDWFGIDTPDTVIAGGLLFDNLAHFVRVCTLILGILIVLVSWREGVDSDRGEFFAMIMFSLAGLMLVGPSANLVTLFLALELVSVPTYALVTLSRNNPKALEAGTKYFYLGAMAAAINAFGFSYLYGVMGSMTLDAASVERVVEALRVPGTAVHAIAVIGLSLSLVGLFFKIAAVPLHFYIADVYQGAANPVAGMLGFVPKLAGLVAIFKVIAIASWATSGGVLFVMLWIVAALSMTVGNVLALRQNSIKRMLAYSGIAHSGYMLVGVLAGPALTGGSYLSNGTAAVLYYAVIYGIANLGLFAMLNLLRVNGRRAETVRDVAGLLRWSPGIAILMAVGMITLMGLPPAPGFWGKLGLFGSALSASESLADGYRTAMIVLVVIGVLNSAIGAAYYLRVVASLLLYENDEPAEPVPTEAPLTGALLCGFLMIAFAFYPNSLLGISEDATQRLLDPPRAQAVRPAPPAEALAIEPFAAARDPRAQ